MSQLIRKIITSSKVPKPLAPYNQAIVIDRTVYCSGMLGLDKATMKVVPGGAAAEAKVALGYINDLLTDCGSGLDRIVKATVLLQDIKDFGAVNEEYKKVMGPNFPCRTCYQAAQLPAGANVEIEVIAYTGDVKTEHVTV